MMKIKAVLLMLMMFYSVYSLAEVPTSTLGETPGADYIQLIRKWAEVTNFAKNAADLSAQRITKDLKKDPKYEKFVTPDLTSDLRQYFYEVYSSKESMQNLAKVYGQYFTVEDLVEMLTFYNTALGRKMILVNNALVTKNDELGSELLKKHEHGYMQIIKKYIKQPMSTPSKK